MLANKEQVGIIVKSVTDFNVYRSLNPSDLIDLSGADFAGFDLTGADFKAANLRGVNFYRAILYSADFTDADVTNANFIACDLQYTVGITTETFADIIKDMRARLTLRI
jgi:uncharacterized protein YjbI with pentapeptide repeats